MSFIVSPPHGNSARDTTDDMSRLFSTGVLPHHALHNANDSSQHFPDGDVADAYTNSAGSTLPRETTSAFSVTLPGQPPVGAVFADAEEGVLCEMPHR